MRFSSGGSASATVLVDCALAKTLDFIRSLEWNRYMVAGLTTVCMLQLCQSSMNVSNGA